MDNIFVDADDMYDFVKNSNCTLFFKCLFCFYFFV